MAFLLYPHFYSARPRLNVGNLWRWLFGLLLSLTMLPGLPVHAQGLTLEDQQGHYNITPNLSWLEAPSHGLSPRQALSKARQDFFTLSGRSALNWGYRDSEFWFYLPINYPANSNTHQHNDWLLQFDYPLLEHVDIFLFANDELIHQDAIGAEKRFSERSFESRTLITGLPIPTQQASELLIRIRTDSVVRVKADLFTVNGLVSYQDWVSTGLGVFLGIMAIMAIYNFFVYVSLGEKSYLLYVFYIVSFAFLQATISGHSSRFLWPDTPTISVHIISVLTLISCFFALRFSGEFLKLATQSPFCNQLTLGLSLLCMVLLPLTFALSGSHAVQLSIGVFYAATLLIIISGLVTWQQGYLQARMFLLGWLCLLPSVFVQGTMMMGLIPDNLFTANIPYVGASLEVLFLALALTDRLNHSQALRAAAERNAHQTLLVAHNQLEKALSEKVNSNQLKDQFLATLSHELRTPMNGVEGSLELISESALDSQQQQYLSTAKKSATEMTQMVDTILRFSELQSGDICLRPQAINLSSLCKEINSSLSDKAEQKGLTIHYEIDPQLPSAIMADPEQLKLVLRQLLDNAIKFTEYGKVSLSIEKCSLNEQSHIVFIIRDSGEGIDQDELDNIFNHFYQAERNDNRRYGGLGIGLALCQQLSQLMGGELTLDSTLGEGTEAHLQMPLQEANEPPANDKVRQKPFQHTRQYKTVLVAEDNPVNQMVLKNLLEKLGCLVLLAGNGQEALDLLEQQPVDLIMMDCQMPVVDGFEATRRIRGHSCFSAIPIIAVTANAMSADNQRCLAAGMNDYIKKPINRDILESKATRWLQTETPWV